MARRSRKGATVANGASTSKKAATNRKDPNSVLGPDNKGLNASALLNPNFNIEETNYGNLGANMSARVPDSEGETAAHIAGTSGWSATNAGKDTKPYCAPPKKGNPEPGGGW